MTGMSTLNPTTQRSIDDAQITTIAARYCDMQINDQEQLRSKLSNFGGIVPVVLDLLRKSTDRITKNSLCIPAMLVAAVAGRKYQSKYDQAHFKTNLLSVMGREGEDWGALAKAYVFGGAFEEYSNVATDGNLGSNLGNLGSNLDFYYECMEEGPVTFRSNCGPSTKFYFVTPLFALRLLVIIQSPRRDAFVAFMLELSKSLVTLKDHEIVNQALEHAAKVAIRVSINNPGESQHNFVRDEIAYKNDGKIESRNKCGIADVETKHDVIEVKPVSQWMHGLGQSLAYGIATKKRPRLVLFGERPPTDICLETCKCLKVDVEFIKT